MKSKNLSYVKRETHQMLVDDRMLPAAQQGVLEKLPDEYLAYLSELKERVILARQRTMVAANQETLLFYYSVGKDLEEFCASKTWGESTIERLARDLQAAFPGVDGFSARNLRRMRSFYRAYPLDNASKEIWPQAVAKLDLVKWPPAVAKLTWAQNIILLEKCKDLAVRSWYAGAALKHGWSRNILALQIESGAHGRQGKAISNFREALPPPHSDLAQLP